MPINFVDPSCKAYELFIHSAEPLNSLEVDIQLPEFIVQSEFRTAASEYGEHITVQQGPKLNKPSDKCANLSRVNGNVDQQLSVATSPHSIQLQRATTPSDYGLFGDIAANSAEAGDEPAQYDGALKYAYGRLGVEIRKTEAIPGVPLRPL